MKILHILAVAALGFVAPAYAQAPVTPLANVSPGEDDQGQAQAVIAKLNAYVSLLNRTLRASDSLKRYESWVNMRTGPTGRESIVYGLYSLYDVRSEIEKAEAAAGGAPPMPGLDQAIPVYISAYQALAPIVEEADGYYERQDYEDDKMAGGRAIHAKLAPAAAAFRNERAKVDALFAAEKAKADYAELAMIEKAEGRSARWHVSKVMFQARRVVDLFPTDMKPVVDMASFESAMTDYAAAVKEMDAFASKNPNSFFVFESQPRSFLGKLREFRTKLQRAKGDARRGAGGDIMWLVNDYNMMVSTSESATRFSR